MAAPDLPPIPPDLLQALNERFPDRCPDPSWPEREIWMRAGERRLVRFLQNAFDRQNDNILRETHVFEQT